MPLKRSKTLFRISFCSPSRFRLFWRMVLANGFRNLTRKSLITFETGLFASASPTSGSLVPKSWPLSTS